MAARRRRSIVSAVSAVLLGVALAAPVVAAGSQVGSLSCGAQRVYLYSTASVWVTHEWTVGSTQYYTPYREYRQTNTMQSSAGWKISWDFEKTSAGAFCDSL